MWHFMGWYSMQPYAYLAFVRIKVSVRQCAVLERHTRHEGPMSPRHTVVITQQQHQPQAVLETVSAHNQPSLGWVVLFLKTNTAFSLIAPFLWKERFHTDTAIYDPWYSQDRIFSLFVFYHSHPQSLMPAIATPLTWMPCPGLGCVTKCFPTMLVIFLGRPHVIPSSVLFINISDLIGQNPQYTYIRKMIAFVSSTKTVPKLEHTSFGGFPSSTIHCSGEDQVAPFQERYKTTF